MARNKRIAIMTGGGDCPGLNAVIRSVAKKAILEYGMEVIGIKDGYEGVIKPDYKKLAFEDVSGILTIGGTILGTSNTAHPYQYHVTDNGRDEYVDVSKQAIANIEAMEIDGMICIGGDGTLTIANALCKEGIPIIGVPKTIDNDILGTDITFGFNSAVAIATEGVDRLHTTAQSHHRVMIVELMGRNAGWIALHTGVASGVEVILIPEIPYRMEHVIEKLESRNREGKRFSLVVVAEGAKPEGGKVVVQKIVKDAAEPIRLGGIGFALGEEITNTYHIDSRTVVMGHLQRSGIPTAFDRVLATRLGCAAIEMMLKKRFGHMVAVKGNDLKAVPLEEVAKGQRSVPVDEPLIRTARSVGTCFGDE
jgi:6-phosphofructokinase 1